MESGLIETRVRVVPNQHDLTQRGKVEGRAASLFGWMKRAGSHDVPKRSRLKTAPT